MSNEFREKKFNVNIQKKKKKERFWLVCFNATSFSHFLLHFFSFFLRFCFVFCLWFCEFWLISNHIKSSINIRFDISNSAVAFHALCCCFFFVFNFRSVVIGLTLSSAQKIKINRQIKSDLCVCCCLIWADILKTVTCSTSTHHIGRRHLLLLIEVVHVVVHHVHRHRRLSIEHVRLLFAMLFGNPYGQRLAATLRYHIIQRRNCLLRFFSLIESKSDQRKFPSICVIECFIFLFIVRVSLESNRLPHECYASWFTTYFVLQDILLYDVTVFTENSFD